VSETLLNEFDRERLSAFKSAMTRGRWLMLTTVLIACFMLLHLFTGEFGYQTQQIKRTLFKRLKNHPTEFLAADVANRQREDATGVVQLGAGTRLSEKWKTYVKASSDRTPSLEADRLARELVEDTYGRLIMNSELRHLQLRDAAVPLLGITTPGNDYLAIMTWMLVIFTTAVWLNVRSLEAILRGISWNSPLRDFVKLYVTFTGIVDGTPGSRVARCLQYAAIWTPATLFLLACALDIVPSVLDQLRDPDYIVMGDPLYVGLRIAIFSLGGLLLVGAAVSSTGRIARIDDWLYSKDRRLGGRDGGTTSQA
jgi:hypothetical protein